MSQREPLVDGFGRVHTNLRVSVTDRCNIRCFYCMPAENVRFKPRRELLNFEEIARFVRVLAEMGVNKVRLTGGEPLVRHDLSVLVAMLAQVPGVRDIALVLMGCKRGGVLATTNERVLREFAPSVDIILIPFLGEQRLGFEVVETNCKKIKKSLALLEEFANFTPALSKKESAAANEEFVDSRGSEK